jgi:putative membrane protein
MRLRYLIIPAASLLALAACNNDAAPPAATDESAETAAADQTMPAETATPMTAQAFADAAAATDMTELEAAKLAQTMGKDKAVKDFAAMMIKDHTKASADLKAAAAKATPAVTPAGAMTAEQKADMAALKSAGDGFDKLYGAKMVAGHEKALEMLKGYAASGDNEALKDFAGKTAPVVSGHLDMARKLPQ